MNDLPFHRKTKENHQLHMHGSRKLENKNLKDNLLFGIGILGYKLMQKREAQTYNMMNTNIWDYQITSVFWGKCLELTI